jgi:hypothetical protein
MQIDARQCRGEPSVLPAYAFGIDDEQRGTVARHQMSDGLS